MSNITMNSNDLIDDLVRNLFGLEPDAMAALAHGDADVERRRLPMREPTTDPLDGVEVLVRRVLAACLAMKKQGGAVSLVTERQARAAGWPSADLANRVIVLAWALAISRPGMAMPVLLAPDETDRSAGRLVRVGAGLRSYEQLRAALRRRRQSDGGLHERSGWTGANGQVSRERQLVALAETLHAWLGVDAAAVELPGDTDSWTPRLTSRNARAACILAWIVDEALDLADIMEEETVPAVRVKTEADACLAGHPGAAAANLALLLGASAHHGTGYTVHFLAADKGAGAALVDAGRGLSDRLSRTDADPQRETVELLELEDVARRGYVHVGRCAAERVALRLWNEARPVRTRAIGEATR